MSKKKKKKSILKSRFYRIYFIVVAVVLIAMACGRIYLNGVLADYESAQPVYVAREVAALFETADYDTIYTVDASAVDIANGDKAFYLDSMNELTYGKTVEWSEAFSPDEDERKYTVTVDGSRLANFTLVPSGETTKRGNRLWKLGGVETLVELAPAVTPEPVILPEATPEPVTGTAIVVKAPVDCTVTVDGVTLTSENAEITEKPMFEDGFLPEGVTSLCYKQYSYMSPNEAPEVEVTDASGAARMVNKVNDTTFRSETPSDATYQQNYTDAATALAKRIAAITARDASVDGIKGYCASKSPAMYIFDNLSNRWATPHSSSSFENMVVDSFYVHSDSCFTCHVKFNFVLKTSAGPQDYPTEYTFCIVQQGGKSKLYNLMMQ